MNKQEELKRLTRKYFWEQKWEEICSFIFLIFMIISFLGVLAQIGWINTNSCNLFYKECNLPYEPMFPRWMMYCGLITTGFWIIIGFLYWIQSNMEEAKNRAKKELKIK